MQWFLNNKLSAALLFLSILFFLVGTIQLLPQNTIQPLDINTNSLSDTSSLEHTNTNDSTTPGSPSATPHTILIDISGSVVNPGVYSLPYNVRISDAIDEAGGLSKKADTVWVAKNINLASKLKDSDKLYIPSKTDTLVIVTASPIASASVAGLTTGQLGHSTSTPLASSNMGSSSSASSSPTTSSDGLISVNAASATELESLPEVGTVTAQKIITNRPYSRLEELKEKKAVGNSAYEQIKDKIKI